MSKETEKEEKEEKKKPEPFFGDDSSDDAIQVVGNKIYYYAEIKRKNILKLNKKIKELELKLIGLGKTFNWEPPPIHLHINSFGGSIFAGVAAVDQILNCQIPVHTLIDGCAASAATFLSVVGKKRYINKHAHILIHQLSSGFWGKFSEIEDEVKNLKRFMDMIKDLYIEHTKIPKKKLDKLLKHDLWLTPEEALKYGMVDEIIG